MPSNVSAKPATALDGPAPFAVQESAPVIAPRNDILRVHDGVSHAQSVAAYHRDNLRQFRLAAEKPLMRAKLSQLPFST